MSNRIRAAALLLAGALCFGALAGCGDAAASVTGEEVEMGLDMVPLGAAPAVSSSITASAPGTAVAQNEYAAIDYSNAQDGYVMIAWLVGGSEKIKVQTTGPSGTTYTYNLSSTGAYETFPLSDGSGSYSVLVLRNTTGTKYAVMHTATVEAQLTDEFAPFLHPNQYVNYSDASQCVALAKTLVADTTDEVGRVGAIYHWVVENIRYDKALASSVESGYLPNLDAVLQKKSGICFDYAALMTAMLRSQDIPTKLVVGYTGNVYHAWINVYSKENGWIDGVISFDGKSWKLMDPTFASTGNSSDEILQYIGNGSNYDAQYLY